MKDIEHEEIYDYNGIKSKHDADLMSLGADNARTMCDCAYGLIKQLNTEFEYEANRTAYELMIPEKDRNLFVNWYDGIYNEATLLLRIIFRLKIELDCLCGYRSEQVESWKRECDALYKLTGE